jgi:NAD-reducing hydrogenase small subunit
MSFLDLDEFLIELAGHLEWVYSPIMDIKEYPDKVDLCLVEGAVCNEDNLAMLHLVRARTSVLVAFGDCAVTGNVPAIRNQLGLGSAESVLQRVYTEGAQAMAAVPHAPGIVPALLTRVAPAHAIVFIDHFLPGCPPPAPRIKEFLQQLLSGATPVLKGPQLKFG